MSNKPHIKKTLEEIKKDYKVWRVVDELRSQLKELFLINHPELKFSPKLADLQEEFAKKDRVEDNWIYFPWSGVATHLLSEKDYFSLRTNRNKNLITQKEQNILDKYCVGVVGLSIGSSVATTLAYQGISSNMKLADFDILEATNLNRLRAGVHQIGLSKLDIVTQQIYEINPYAKLNIYEKGLGEENMENFLTDSPKPKVIIDAVDDLKAKIKLRLLARKQGIVVLMFTNLGDSVMVDIERYDIEPKLAIFNGRIGQWPEKIITDKITKQEENKYVLGIVGMENIPQRALESVREIGKSLVGRPQLVSSVTVSGGIATFIIKQLALGNEITSGRRLIDFNSLLKD